MKIRIEKVIEVRDWNELVIKTYGRPYSFQQQDGCKGRGVFRFSVPRADAIDYDRDSIPEVVNHEERGVGFAAWLARDPSQRLSSPDDQQDYCLDLWWNRSFYPELQMIANDLHKRGLIKTGSYTINIDW